ncbi:hypothetical protein LTS17_010827 [Exophiala oligosperma]
MEALCQQLSKFVDTLNRSQPHLFGEGTQISTARADEHASQSLHLAARTGDSSSNTVLARSSRWDLPPGRQSSADAVYPPSDVLDSSDDNDADDDDNDVYENTAQNDVSDMVESQSSAAANRVGALVGDSYGHLRFVGGASNIMLIEAAQHDHPIEPAVTTIAQSNQSASASKDVELPLFVRGRVWPELPFLPKPDQLPRPPQYIADLLVKLYFDQLHYTFPVVFKPHFLERYRQLYRTGSRGTALTDSKFTMVFFAVCACASSLLPTSPESRFPGLEYYEKALLLYYASTGEVSLDKVQCLALLAMCCAGWNTLSQSWIITGQAVRAAQDLGLHLSSALMMPPSSNVNIPAPSDFLHRQISRRVWWCIYSLERVTSICLGRPAAILDEDCNCEMPLNVSDEDLELFAHQPNSIDSHYDPKASSPAMGFLAFAKLCRIAGKIQQLNSPRRIGELASADPDKMRKFSAKVASRDRLLRSYLESLPDEICFSANVSQWDHDRNYHLTMCMIIFIVHSGSLLNLYRSFVGDSQQASHLNASMEAVDAVAQCISAARSCINAAELVRDSVPPSHYLAICLHYLTLSGIMLIRIPSSQPRHEIIEDVEKCVSFLKGLEARWSGASRSRSIIERLLENYRHRTSTEGYQEGDLLQQSRVGQGYKRTFTDFMGVDLGETVDESVLWHQLAGPELFMWEGNDPGGLSLWDRP